MDDPKAAAPGDRHVGIRHVEAFSSNRPQYHSGRRGYVLPLTPHRFPCGVVVRWFTGRWRLHGPLFYPDFEEKNAQTCADIQARSADGGSVAMFTGVTFRASSRGSISPYARA